MTKFDLQSFAHVHQLDAEAVAELEAYIKSVASNALSASDSMLSPQGRLNALFFLESAHGPVTLHEPDVEEHSKPRVSTLEMPQGEVFEGDGARYQCIGLLGRGGMGEVWRVRDKDLNRTLAMKIIRWDLVSNEQIAARFIDEAQTCAQLQHPGVMPVFEIGQFPDGRFYFTMQEIIGRNLQIIADEVHAVSRKAGHWGVTDDGWGLQRLIHAFARVCETMAYVHKRGVLHRDLKPSNVMFGDNGQVLVVDWGIAKILGRPDHIASLDDPLGPVTTRRLQAGGEDLTQPGAITGTPNYMPVEQALSRLGEVDERSDVYALGAMLYMILSGAPPYGSGHTFGLLMRIAKGPPKPLSEVLDYPVPEELIAICTRAMARDRENRYNNASELSDAINAWSEGVRQREIASMLVDQACGIDHKAKLLREQGKMFDAQAARLLRDVPGWSDEEKKRPGWDLQENARQSYAKAALRTLEAEQGMQAALTYVPDLPKAHEALAVHYLDKHRRAELAHDTARAQESEVLLRTHVHALPLDHERVEEFKTYLDGRGQLTLHTSLADAHVELHRYHLEHKRLRPVHVRDLESGSVDAMPLDAGSYLAVIKASGHHEVHYPIHIPRLGHWTSMPPEVTAPESIFIPNKGAILDDEVYVPAGWFIAGGEQGCAGGFDRKSYWSDGFVVQKFPVTNKEFLKFLNELHCSGRSDEATQHAPRERAVAAGEQGSLLYAYNETRGFSLIEDPSRGRVVHLEWPVTNIDWYGAKAYGAWYAEHTKKPWRMLTEWEWEKAARGVDGRAYPWGDAFDPSWSCMQDSRPMQPHADVVESFPVDVSPYGVRGMAGNVCTWCEGVFTDEPPASPRLKAPSFLYPEGASHVGRGGAWFFPPHFCQSPWRLRFVPTYRYGFLGLRLMRPM